MNAAQRKRNRRRWWVAFFLTLLIVCFTFPWLLPKGQRWYVLNPRYALWRYGWHSYDQQIVYEGLKGDIWRDNVVRGRTLPELHAMFTDLRSVAEFDPSDLAKVSSRTNATRTFVRWADTYWFIELTHGKATAIYLWKG